MSAPSVLDLRGVEVRTGGRVILSVEALSVAPGEIVALLGPNGAGKTTLLHVAAALLRPDRGEVRIGGDLVDPGSERRLRGEVGLVFQAPLLFSTSVLENVASGLRFRGVPKREAERAALEWLKRFGVEGLAGRRPRGLSGGEAQRVSLARAFATRPRLVLLDEPFAALDAPTRHVLGPALLAELRDAGAAAVLVTHDLGEALALGDRVGVLLGGRLAQIGQPGQVLARPTSVAVARLLGVENLLPARVLDGEDDRLRVALADGAIWEVPTTRPEAFPEGTRVTLTMRASALAPLVAGETPPAGWIVVEGRVAAVQATPLGERVTVAGSVRVEVHRGGPGRAPAPGENVRVALPPEAVHVIPEG